MLHHAALYRKAPTRVMKNEFMSLGQVIDLTWVNF